MPAYRKQAVAGGLAGTLELCCLYPLDVVKTQTQICPKKRGITRTVQSIFKHQGFGGFYRGFLSPFVAEVPKHVVKFAGKDVVAHQLPRKSAGTEALAGTLVGILEVSFQCPTELVKVQMQDPTKYGKYTSTFDAFRQLVTKQPKTLYKGACLHAWRNASWNGVYFGTIEALRTPTDTSHDRFLAGTVSGLLATVVNTPFDTLKSRVQSNLSQKTPFTFQLIRDTVKKHGVKSVYAGLLPRVLRLGLGGGIMNMAFEAIKQRL